MVAVDLCRTPVVVGTGKAVQPDGAWRCKASGPPQDVFNRRRWERDGLAVQSFVNEFAKDFKLLLFKFELARCYGPIS